MPIVNQHGVMCTPTSRWWIMPIYILGFSIGSVIVTRYRWIPVFACMIPLYDSYHFVLYRWLSSTRLHYTPHVSSLACFQFPSQSREQSAHDVRSPKQSSTSWWKNSISQLTTRWSEKHAVPIVGTFTDSGRDGVAGTSCKLWLVKGTSIFLSKSWHRRELGEQNSFDYC